MISHSTVQVQSGPCPQDLGSVPHAAGPYHGCPAAGGITPSVEDLQFLKLYKILSLTKMKSPMFTNYGLIYVNASHIFLWADTMSHSELGSKEIINQLSNKLLFITMIIKMVTCF